jgi:hypothetical protein
VQPFTPKDPLLCRSRAKIHCDTPQRQYYINGISKTMADSPSLPTPSSLSDVIDIPSPPSKKPGGRTRTHGESTKKAARNTASTHVTGAQRRGTPQAGPRQTRTNNSVDFRSLYPWEAKYNLKDNIVGTDSRGNPIYGETQQQKSFTGESRPNINYVWTPSYCAWCHWP